MKRKRQASSVSYLATTLAPGEQIVVNAVIHWAIFVMPVLLGWLASYVLFRLFEVMGVRDLSVSWIPVLPALVCFLKVSIYWLTTEAAVTSSRVLYKTGWISRDVSEISISKVESVVLKQSIVGRVFGFGTIKVRGTGGSGVTIEGVAVPLEFRSAVQSIAMAR